MPVLAAIQGGCIGGAVDLVTACDLRYASADAFFVIQEINIGMTADVGTLQRLPKLIPEGIARELAYVGGRLPAARAYEIGLVNQVFDDHAALVDGHAGGGRRDRGQEPAGHLGIQGDDHLLARSLGGRRRSTTSPPGRPACSSRPT